MKDLCDVETDQQDAAWDQHPDGEERDVSKAIKIKSFHRRKRPANPADKESAPTSHPVAIEPPRPSVEPSAEVVMEHDPIVPDRKPRLWSQIPTTRIDAELAAQRALPLVDRFRESESAKAIDLLRTRLLHTLRAQGWRRVAIASPTSGCGATWMTVNLAQGLARVPNSRTIIMDMNFRKPGLAQALALPSQGDMAGFLSGRLPAQRHLLRLTDGLVVGLNGDSKTTGSEVLHNPTTGKVIDAMMEDSRADVALFDLPPVLEHDDLSAFLPQVDAVLLVADGNRTTAKDLAACEKILAGHTQLLGVVLNRARPE